MKLRIFLIITLMFLITAVSTYSDEVNTIHKLTAGQKFRIVSNNTWENTTGSKTSTHKIETEIIVTIDKIVDDRITCIAEATKFDIVEGDMDISPHRFGELEKGEKLVFDISPLGWVKKTHMQPESRGYWSAYFYFFGFPYEKMTTEKPWELNYTRHDKNLGTIKQTEKLVLKKVRKTGIKKEGLIEYTNNSYNSAGTYKDYATYKLVWNDNERYISRGTSSSHSKRPHFKFVKDSIPVAQEYRTTGTWKMFPVRKVFEDEEWPE